MKGNILAHLGFKLKVQIWFKNNPNPFIMYLRTFEFEKKQGKFTHMTWVTFEEKYQFSIDEVIACKYRTVWKPF